MLHSVCVCVCVCVFNTGEESSTQESQERQGAADLIQPLKSGTSEADEDETPAAKKPKLFTASKSVSVDLSSQGKEMDNPLKRSERLKSLSDIPSDMSFETEIPVLEKSSRATTSAKSGLQSSSEHQTPLKEQESSGDSVKVSSLGVLFESTVHNSNVMHVCCQLRDNCVLSKATSGKDSGKWARIRREGGRKERESERGGW